jgi:hypothetical protein
MSLQPSDLDFEYLEFPDLDEETELKIRYLAAKEGVPVSCFVASVLARLIAESEGDTVGDYRYSGPRD